MGIANDRIPSNKTSGWHSPKREFAVEPAVLLESLTTNWCVLRSDTGAVGIPRCVFL